MVFPAEVAFKVTVLPLQMLVALDGVTLVGAATVVTLMVVPELVAVAGEGHVALLVIEHVITSPLAGV